MKKLVFLLSALSLMACNKNEDNENVEKTSSYELSDWAMMKEVEVSVPEGQKAMVYVGESLKAEVLGPQETSVIVPAYAKASSGVRSGVNMSQLEYKVEYVPMSGEQASTYSDQATIAFEDLRENIDGDYNDLIVDVKSLMSVRKSGDDLIVNVSFLQIAPIAMGAEYDMAFGCKIVAFSADNELLDSVDVVLSDDVRRDYFGSTKGMINTTIGKTDYETQKQENLAGKVAEFKGLAMLSGVKVQLIYYIDVENTGWRHYAVAVAETANNMAYKLGFDGEFVGAGVKQDVIHALGLYLPSVDSEAIEGSEPIAPFRYPAEKISIFDVYPNFAKWLAGEKGFNPFVDPTAGLYK